MPRCAPPRHRFEHEPRTQGRDRGPVPARPLRSPDAPRVILVAVLSGKWSGHARGQQSGMKPSPKTLKTAKWAGAVGCVLLALVWIGSYWWDVRWQSQARFRFEVCSGGVVARAWHSSDIPRTGWKHSRSTGAFRWWIDSRSGSTHQWIFVPLWVLVVPAVISTAVVWRRDVVLRRRTRAGLCSACGYDRRGIDAASPCPECGAEQRGRGCRWAPHPQSRRNPLRDCRTRRPKAYIDS